MGRLGDHPNIMPIFDLGEENGQPLMVGGDVEGLIKDLEDSQLSLELALRIDTDYNRIDNMDDLTRYIELSF